jgi:SAM-dependent methyltransferase
MIDPTVFRVSREVARAKLDPAVAGESFGYYIDIPNDWESYRSPDQLVSLLGIHQTHESFYPEIVNDLGLLTAAERVWAKRYLRFIDGVAGLLTTNTTRPRLQFDLAETLFDWRTILKFTELPARVLDYGAGCGRQCISTFLHNPDSIYTAIDSTLAAYTVQNLVLSLMDAMGAPVRSVDFLDLETIAIAERPSIAAAPAGSRFHIPAWFEAEPLPERFFDVILACYVHNELSRSDFLRLIAAVEKSLADDGIFYVRGQLGGHFSKGYFDTVDLHGMNLVELLKGKDIVPIYCSCTGGQPSTVFARIGSRRWEAAFASTQRENDFWDMGDSFAVTVRAGQNYTLGVLDWLAASGRRTAFCGAGGDMYGKVVAPVVERVSPRVVFTREECFTGSADFTRQLAEFDPEVVVLGDDFPAFEPLVKATLGGEFKVRLHQALPIVFLCREFQHEPDPIFLSDIRFPGDIERILGEPGPTSERGRSAFLDRL